MAKIGKRLLKNLELLDSEEFVPCVRIYSDGVCLIEKPIDAGIEVVNFHSLDELAAYLESLAPRKQRILGPDEIMQKGAIAYFADGIRW
jgi:hypothetical protein